MRILCILNKNNMQTFLTSRQQLVLDTIEGYWNNNSTSPSLGELQQLLNIKTKRGVVNHLNALEKKGYLMRSSAARSIKLTDQIRSDGIAHVDILGFANAGAPMTYAEQEKVGTLRIAKTLLPITDGLFALEIKGDSMDQKVINGTTLRNGNFAIISKTQQAASGDAVLAIIDECATIKTLKQDKKVIVLYPESSNMVHQPIYLSSSEADSIHGKVISVLENPANFG